MFRQFFNDFLANEYTAEDLLQKDAVWIMLRDV
jgi:hypothetical protein